MGQVIFVTGTDTNVGKTLLVALLLRHLRQCGRHARAMKPFCTGPLRDTRLLFRAQDGELALEEITPFHFAEPLAPGIAARRAGRPVLLEDVVTRIRTLAARCEILLVEGAGGLLVPLGSGYSVIDLIAALKTPAVVVVRNRLGAINHTLLTLAALQRAQISSVRAVLMDAAHPTLATRTNRRFLPEFCAPVPLIEIAYLGRHPAAGGSLDVHAKKLKKALAAVLPMDLVSAAFRRGQHRERPEKKSLAER